MRGVALFILIAFIIVVGAVGGYVIGTHRFPTIGTAFLTPVPTSHISPTAQALSPTHASPSATLSPSQLQSSAAATAFYTWYIDCVNHHFQVKSQKSVTEDCPYQTNSNASTELASAISNKTTSSDPILCAQNTPDSITVANVTNQNDTNAVVTIVETFGSVQRQVRVAVSLENNKWKVSNITCPSA